MCNGRIACLLFDIALTLKAGATTIGRVFTLGRL
jgi:hypothetical protein